MMVERKKKIKIIQISLLLLGLLIIFFTYIKKDNTSVDRIITSEAQKKIERLIEENIQRFTATLSPKTMSFSGERTLHLKS